MQKVAVIDGVLLGFTQGRFDQWCVCVLGKNLPKYPKDEWYFSVVKGWMSNRDKALIYEDFCTIYDATSKTAEKDTLNLIYQLSQSYHNPVEAQIIFTILYMGMIAEENKDGAILGKRIKRLGIHQVLLDGLEPKVAANFSRGKAATALTLECHSRGF